MLAESPKKPAEDRPLSSRDAADFLTIHEGTLRTWRLKTRRSGKQVGPPWKSMGSRVIYIRSDLLRWARDQEQA